MAQAAGARRVPSYPDATPNASESDGSGPREMRKTAEMGRKPQSAWGRYQAVAVSFVLIWVVFFAFNAVWPHPPVIGVVIQVAASVVIGPTLLSVLGTLYRHWVSPRRG